MSNRDKDAEERSGAEGPPRATRLGGVQGSPPSEIEALMPAVYEELRRLASSYLRRERDAQSMQPTALVHEVYLRMLKDKPMRRILVERARARHALKRGGVAPRLTLDERVMEDPAAADTDRHGHDSVDVLALDQALERLTDMDPQRARIVELRYFGGLSVEETAAEMDMSPATVKRHWAVARAWLARELQ